MEIVLTILYSEEQAQISVIGNLKEQPFDMLRKVLAAAEHQIKLAEFEAYYIQKMQQEGATSEDNSTE